MDLERLKKLQEELSNRVVLKDYIRIDELRYVAGVDQAFIKRGERERVISACVVLSFPDLNPVSKRVSVENIDFPYIPTFLMFREGKPAVKVLKKALRGIEKVVILVDGSGIAHPRRCGLATYIALELGIPTVGITKKKLFGDVVYPKEVMKESPIYYGEDVIGYALKTCSNCKPIFISPGSYITPETSLKIVKSCLKGHKLPEPIRLAHELATRSRSGTDLSSFFEI